MPRAATLWLVVAVGVLSISAAAPLIKSCTDAPAVVIAAARLGIASCLLLPAAGLVRGRRVWQVPPSAGKYIILAGVFLAAHFLLWMTSLKYTSVVSSVVIVTTNPMFVGIASYFLFKERIRRGLVVGIVLAFGGGALIALADTRTPHGGSSLYGDLLALGGAVMASCYWLAGRKVRSQVDALTYVTGVYAVAAVILVGTMLALGHGFGGYRNETYVYFVLLAVVPQLLGHSAFNWAIKHISATRIAVFILGEPIGAGILAYAFLEESVGRLQGLGSGLILLGIVLAASGGSQTCPSGKPA